MTLQPLITSLPESTATINFVDPCLDPELLTATAQINPLNYDYTGQFPSTQFYLAPFVVEPPVCAIQYSCQVIVGDRLDLC